MNLLTLFTLFTIKHFICDFPLQIKMMYSNKHKYGHWGGVLHALVHAAGTTAVFLYFTPYALLLGLLDGFIHYHIDCAKMNLNSHWGLKPDNSEYFWWLLGADQLAHYLTYCWLIYYFTLI